ncbi:sarcosine oxidase subunit alpha [Cohaesibacter sp. ES.047]|uniref:sarcosine oxidase subunit alpha n=1 Tax=Cohaesibacter sp. ES.047 TaxID=1798205 RepID=UPI000BB874F7|nr:sarcosine oxidase subunit alpha [Cohaesibacter sp. ES.047]SNY94142.1 sarcosine oxidase subunit alpha [Cohaesibacter sp. ES.047]
MSDFRVSGAGRVDPSNPVSFTFDGKSYRGAKGDTIASALLANGVHLIGRSYKYNRPRGPVTAGSEEPNALVGTSRGKGRYEPNSHATMHEIWNGLEVTSQNKGPSLKFHVGAINDFAFMFFSAGFYYKTFMWPRVLWDRLYEPFIRNAAGLGTSPSEEDPDHYASRYMHCDVLIVGAGPSGLAAARAAAVDGLKVVVVDEHSEVGGSLLSEPQAVINGKPAWDWLEAEVTELKALGVKIMPHTTAIGYYHQNMIGLCQKVSDHLEHVPDGMPRERLWRVRAKQVVLAQGAIEKPLVFHCNDRPGVMLAGSVQTYLNRYGVKVGNRPLVITSHDSAWFAAFDLHDAGAKVQAIVDVREDVRGDLVAEANRRSIPVKLSHTVSETAGRLRIKRVRINPVKGGSVGAGEWIACDVLLMSGGWTPSLHLFSHTKGTLTWDDDRTTFLPNETPEDCVITGASRGLWGLQDAMTDGMLAGQKVAFLLGKDAEALDYVIGNDRIGSGVSLKELPTDKNAGKAKAFVDFQSDVTAKDLRLAVREGMRSIEHVKRYTTNGMGADQGKMSNINGLNITADALSRKQPKVGLTTFRPPFTPITFGTLAGYHSGEHFEVTRKTQIDGWAEENGAVFEPVGQWRRARYFPRAGEDMDTAVRRECVATRKSLGIFDASTLGKIEVVGPDAVEFMNRIYTNPWTKLGVGRCRYGLLLGDDGYIRDDGVIGRLAEDRFHVTTTTGGAARVLNHMEDFLQTEWPDLNVWLTSTTEQWSTIALNGPNAAKLLAPLVEGVELSDEAFPHMSCVDCTVAGMPARLFRVSFTGEIGFEVNVPAPMGRAMWEILWAEGQQYNIMPYGTETMHVLRAEKGYIIVGQDTDGTVTPYDAGMGWAVGKKKPDFVGKRGLARPDLVAEGRKQLVGLLSSDLSKLEEGAQIVLDPKQPVPMTMVGHVTSSYHSDTVGQPIALALVENGHNKLGETVYIPMPDRTIEARVAETVFVDPENSRLKI